MDWEFTDYDPGEMEGAFLLVAVPVTRNVPTIVASALLRSPQRRLAVAINSDRLPPVSMSYAGVVSGPMHVWALPGPAGPRLAGRELLVLASDVRLVPEALMGFCGALARWAKEKRIGFALAIEAADADEVPAAPSLAATYAGEGALDALGLPKYEGVHAGFNAAFLARFNQHKLAAAGVFAPSAGDPVSDATAAVRVLQAIAPLLPRPLVAGNLDRLAHDAAELVARTLADQEAARQGLMASARGDPGYL